VLCSIRGNLSITLEDAATAYRVDTDSIVAIVRQEFTAKEKARKTAQPATNTGKKAA